MMNGFVRRSPAADKILDVAEQLAQTRGFNGFSYADIAAKLRLTKASLHYHFPSKADLGRALIARYHEAFDHALKEIDQRPDNPAKKLRRYSALYDDVMRNKRICLCGMLAAEYATLPKPMQRELRRFFDANEEWLSSVLEDGRKTGVLRFRDPPKERARLILGALEGAMLVAHSYGDDRRFRSTVEHLFGELDVHNGTAARRKRQLAQ